MTIGTLAAMNRPADARADALEALSDAVQAIGGVLAIEDVLQLIVDRVRVLVGARYAALGIGETGAIEQFVTSGIDQQTRAAIGPLPKGHGLLGLIIREGHSYRIPDIARHPDSYGFPPNHPPMKSFLGVPVGIEGRPIGNLYLTEKEGAAEFSEADQRLVELFASHAAIAVENARLRDQLRRLAIVDERERIAKDLHDGVIQAIYAVALSLEDVPDMMAGEPDEARRRVDRAIDQLNLTIRDLRSFIAGLGPEIVEQTDLVGVLGAMVDQFRLTTMTDVELRLPDEIIDVSIAVRVELAQIVREALSNVARHAGASRARLGLDIEEGRWLRLEIADNGRGFVVEEDREAGHLGLSNMADRADALGGTLEVDSSTGVGTRIIVRVPALASDGLAVEPTVEGSP